MVVQRRLVDSWNALPVGARVALDQQWAGLAAGGLPCGSAILDADESILAAGRNHAYDPPEGVESRALCPLQHTRLAHAELNAIALLATETEHASLTLWSTQHPCAMCAAAVRFVGIGKVCFVADDPSDDSSAGVIVATRGGVSYEAMGDPLWWTISNLLFLYNSALQKGGDARNLPNQPRSIPGVSSSHARPGKARRVGALSSIGNTVASCYRIPRGLDQACFPICPAVSVAASFNVKTFPTRPASVPFALCFRATPRSGKGRISVKQVPGMCPGGQGGPISRMSRSTAVTPKRKNRKRD